MFAKFASAILFCIVLCQEVSTQSPIRWEKDQPNTDKVTIDGRIKKSITLDGATFWVSLAEQRLGSETVYYDKFVVYAGLVNESERRIEIAPGMITVAAVKPKPKPLARETAEHLANSVKQWSAIGGSLGQISANTSTTQSQTTGTVNSAGRTGTYSGTTTSPDYAARQRADRQATDLNRSASAAGADMVRLELKANTILPGDAYAGMLIFARDKKCEEAIVTFAIDGKVIEFPFTWLRK